MTDPRRTDPQVAADLREGALSGLRRFFSAVPQAVRDWPRQAWEMVRLPADLVLGSPEERAIDEEWGESAIKPLPRALNPHRPGTPESKAYETMSFANPISSAVFAPMQTARAISSPMGQATMGALASLMLPGVSMPAQFVGAGVLKPKGGQWLTHTVDDALAPLKKQPRWLSGEVINELAGEDLWKRIVTEGGHRDSYKWLRENRPDLYEKAIGENYSGLNRWIDTTLRKYIMRDMATPDDPVRALAERGVLHFDPMPEDAFGSADRMRFFAGKAGNKTGALGRSAGARAWEDLADTEVMTNPVSHFRSPTEVEDVPNDWMAKLAAEAPSTPIYQLNHELSFGQQLGLNHLIDELSNALDPQSGLPRELLLDPKSLQRLSMPQAVERVAKINAWREAQKVAANEALANNAATVLFKEYPENNPRGLRWVELKAAGEDPNLPSARLDRRQALQDALKYEGDAMGHCVGGYCDDVLEGRSRIFSLRDAKGQPHVTVETKPPKVNLPREEMRSAKDMTAEEIDQISKQLGAHYATVKDVQEKGWLFHPRVQYWIDEPSLTNSIVQIKGKGNKKPVDEYLPFVQDFVRSQKWSDVGDLQNTGLRRARDVWNDLEAKKIREAGAEFGDYVSPEEIEEIGKKVWGDAWGKMAEGGAVPWPAALDEPSGWAAFNWEGAA